MDPIFVWKIFTAPPRPPLCPPKKNEKNEKFLELPNLPNICTYQTIFGQRGLNFENALQGNFSFDITITNCKVKHLTSQKKFTLAPMGILASVSGHAGHSAQTPIDTSGNFSAPVSTE